MGREIIFQIALMHLLLFSISGFGWIHGPFAISVEMQASVKTVRS
jgi:hypothetical protein